LIKDINPGAPSSLGGNYEQGSTCLFGGKLFFNARTASAGLELWATDGTAAGTQQFSNFTDATLPDFRVYTMTSTASKVLLSAQNRTANVELWSCTAAPGSLALLKEINPSASTGSDPQAFTTIGNNTFFSANDGTNGHELWVTDGTAAGTRMVKDLRSGVNVGSQPHGLVVFKGQLYFFATNGAGSVGLYRSDGTAAGTVLCHAISATVYVSGVTVTTGRLYYLANGTVTTLWRTDGTTANHVKVAPNMRTSATRPYREDALVAQGNTLYFMADYLGSGTSLYKIVDPAFVPPKITK